MYNVGKSTYIRTKRKAGLTFKNKNMNLKIQTEIGKQRKQRLNLVLIPASEYSSLSRV